MRHEQPKPIWVVVSVESGIPVTVEAYHKREFAEKREQLLREDMNPDNDESGVFQVQMDYSGMSNDCHG